MKETTLNDREKSTRVPTSAARIRKPRPFRIRLWSLLALAAISAACLVFATVGFDVPASIKERALSRLSSRFASRVSIETLHVAFFPHLRVVGRGVVFQHHDRTDIPPLFTLREFDAETAYFSALRHPHHINRVKLIGLDIHTPPRNHEPGEKRASGEESAMPPVAIVDVLTADNARLTTLPKDPNKVPLEWDIFHLEMKGVTTDRPASYTAQLTNPRPEGSIDVTGSFGPWDSGDPSLTPVSGNYTFSRADLGTLKGIGGILESKGQFSGELDYLNVNGETTTPDFRVDIAGHPVSLNTQYAAVVNGTNGNTYLQPVTPVSCAPH